MSERQYAAMEVARIAGVSYRQVDHWVRGGYVQASVDPAGGSGNPRLFGFSDVARAVAVVLSVADRVLVDCHRKAKCTGDFGPVRLTVDMTAVRKKVAAS